MSTIVIRGQKNTACSRHSPKNGYSPGSAFVPPIMRPSKLNDVGADVGKGKCSSARVQEANRMYDSDRRMLLRCNDYGFSV